ncbi:hypothetical protein BaRGS_00030075 [Batillaria attramentaria]|uniref:Uncharacterized protein n=1 Tax=Batillaria attramentaria TaxID=370345 RepID=A0ABD0JVS4_9CAEN
MQAVAAPDPMTNTHICCVVMVMSAYGLTMQAVAAPDPMTNTHICCDGHVSLRPNNAGCCGARSYDKNTYISYRCAMKSSYELYCTINERIQTTFRVAQDLLKL